MNGWRERARSWVPPEDWIRVRTIDAHTEGEPLRVILSGFDHLDGATVLERRRDARRTADGLRRALMWEPRGHADMYGCIVMPGVTPGADLSVLFTHNAGYSTMCGHGIIAVTTVILECGLLGGTPVEGELRLEIDTPAGRVTAFARPGPGGRVERVRFENVPSFVARLDASVEVPSVGPVAYDMAYGGAFYAFVDAEAFGLRLVPSEAARLIDLGRAIKTAVQAHDPPTHPDDPELGFVYGTIFVGPAHHDGHHSRNVCVFADGEVDRCPTGTGVSARLALHHTRDAIGGEEIVVESILGTTFGGRVLRSGPTVDGAIGATVVPEVSGRAWITGRHEFLLAPDDPLREGVLVR